MKSLLPILLTLLLNSCFLQDPIQEIERAFDNKDWERAAKLLETYISKDSTDPMAFHHLGFAYSNLDNLPNALSAYNKAIILKPMSETFYNRGRIHSKIKNDLAAFQDYNEAIKIDSTDADYFYDRGLCKYKLSMDPISDYCKAVFLDSTFINAYFSRGSAYKAAKVYDKAIEDYKAVISLSPKDGEAFYALADSYILFGDTLTGCEYFKKALKLKFIKELPTYCKEF